MPDREQVIEGFEMSYKYSNVDESNTLVPQQLVLDALALLKAQEPRVMADTELEAIRKAPIVLKPNMDAVTVVRCRDCMYFRPWRHNRGDDSRCEFWNTEMGADDYCSQAIYLNNGRNDNGKDA